MRVPVIEGMIDRRVLVNFTVEPEILASQLPAPFRPKIVRGKGVVGVCLIRLDEIRPRHLPALIGASSENAAHRMAVEWDTPEGVREGVYIPRRDTSSRLNVLAGGRIFPGEHHLADFAVFDRDGEVRITVRSKDGKTRLRVEGRTSEALPKESIFGSLEEASSFFERGSLGYSATSRPGEFDGLELRTSQWQVQPLEMTRVESSFFQDQDRFPDGAARFDCALLMRRVAHEWHGRERLATSPDDRRQRGCQA